MKNSFKGWFKPAFFIKLILMEEKIKELEKMLEDSLKYQIEQQKIIERLKSENRLLKQIIVEMEKK